MPLRKATLDVVQQARTLIQESGPVYNQDSDLSMSPIGKHIRHIIDHFWAFQSGLDNGCIDYNLRRRDTLLETSPTLALNALTEFETWLGNNALADISVTVISEISVSQCESSTMTSNLNRELAYLINHTLHHIAYTKLLAKTLGIDLPEHLGVAPATATYLRNQQASACARSA